jgi:hypothetical protein
MNSISFALLALFNLTIFVVTGISLVRILRRMGLSGWWLLTIGFWPITLWILSRCRWPAFDEESV